MWLCLNGIYRCEENGANRVVTEMPESAKKNITSFLLTRVYINPHTKALVRQPRECPENAADFVSVSKRISKLTIEGAVIE